MPSNGASWSYGFLCDGHISVEVPLSEELIEKFREWYSLRVKHRDTVKNTLRYIRLFGYLLNKPKIVFMETLSKDSRRPYILDALSNYTRFLDYMLETAIYHRKFEYLKEGLRRSKERKVFTGFAPKLEDLEAFYHALLEHGYQAAIDLFRTTLFSGCRPPSEARLVIRKIREKNYFITNKVAVIHVWKITGVKNLYITLIPEELLETLKQRKGLGRTFKVKEAWNYAREKTGLKTLRPYDLRDFYATWLRANGIPKADIDLLQGRLPLRKVQEEHYLDLKTPHSPFLTSLAAKYRAAMQPLIPKFLR